MVGKQPQAKDSRSGGAPGGQPRRWALLVAGLVVVVLLVAGPLRSVLFEPSPLPPSEPQQARSLPLPAPAPPKDDGEEDRVIRSEGVETPPAPPPTSSHSDEQTPSSTSSTPEVVKTIPLPPEDTTTVTGPALAETPAATPEKSQPPPAAPPQVSAAEPKPAAPAPAKGSKNKALELYAEDGRGTDWLKAQAEGNFTLQLMAIKDEATARQFIEAHHLQGKAAYFPVMSNGQTLYAVVYGSYPQRSEAVRAAKGLPKAWGTPNPWIRSFKSLPALNP
jgi:DamX protein